MATVYYQVIKTADGSKKYLKVEKGRYEWAVFHNVQDCIHKTSEERFKRLVEKYED